MSHSAPISLRCPHCGHYTPHSMQSDGLYLWAYCEQCHRSHPVVGKELPELVRAVARHNGDRTPSGDLPPEPPALTSRR